MTDDELIALLSDLESDLVERKSSLAEKDRTCEAICAFANDLPNHRQPGIVFVGAADDGNPSGLAITDALLLQLSDLRTNGNIHPFPSMTVEKRRLCGAEMAVVVVHPSIAPPVRFRGRTWIRVGRRRCARWDWSNGSAWASPSLVTNSSRTAVRRLSSSPTTPTSSSP